jgi:hypothetical protein
MGSDGTALSYYSKFAIAAQNLDIGLPRVNITSELTERKEGYNAEVIANSLFVSLLSHIITNRSFASKSLKSQKS